MRWLIDTVPLVAYVDAADPAHESVAAVLDTFTGRLQTTSAVVTEALHMVSADLDGPEILVEFLLSTATEVAEVGRPGQLQAAVGLMKKYRDTPMDFADATLVLLGDRLSVLDILTLDRRGFLTYRAASGKAFRLVLPRIR